MDNQSPNSLTELDADNVEETEEMVTASLFEVMTSRNRYLSENELWALCRECCLTLEYVFDCHDLFQSLCISPYTVAFDPEGNFCFLDLDAEPESIYLPPEHTSGHKTYKTHLYSLGMTLLFATEYNTSSTDSEALLSDTFMNLLTTLTLEESERRPGLHAVLDACDTALAGESSQEICMKILECQSSESSESKGNESGSSFQEMTDELSSYLDSQSGLVQSRISDTVCEDKDGNIHAGKQGKRKSTTPDKPKNPPKDINDNSIDKLASSDIVITHVNSEQSNLFKPFILSNAECGDAGTESEDTDDTIAEQPEKYMCILLADLLTSLKRRAEESELWSICREAVLFLQRKRTNLPAYISLDTMIIMETGKICIKEISEDCPLEDMYMAPELQQRGLLNEKTCLYGLGISLQTAASFKCSSHSASNIEALDILIKSFINANPDMRPDLDTAFEMCEEYEKVSKTSSQQVCLQLFEEAMKTSGSFGDTGSEKMRQVSAETTDHLVPKESTKPDDTIAEIQHYVEQKSIQTQSPRSHSAFKVMEISRSAVSNPQSVSAFKQVVAESKPLHDVSRIPTAFSSPATHFKPIVIHSTSTEAAVAGQKNTLESQTVKDSHVMDRQIKQSHQEHISQSSSKDLREFERITDRQSVSRKQISDANIHTGSNNTGYILNQLKSQYLTDSTAPQHHIITDQRNFNNVSDTYRDSSVANNCVQMPATVPQFSTKSKPNQNLPFYYQNIPASFQSMPPSNQTAIMTAASNSVLLQNQTRPYLQNISTTQETNVRTDNLRGKIPTSVSNNPAAGDPLMQGSSTFAFPLHTANTETHSGHYLVPLSGYSQTNWPLQYSLVQDPTTGLMQVLPVQYIPVSHMQTSQDNPLVYSHHSDLNMNGLPLSGNKSYNTGHIEMAHSLRFPRETNYLGIPPDKQMPSPGNQQYNDRSHSTTNHSSPLKPVFKTSIDHQRHEEDNMKSTATSPSKDSGISLNQQSDNLPYSMDKLGLADRVLSNVVHILQDTFATDLSVDLGTEDISIGKYVMSLSCLTWDTFCHAITEKYVPLAWSNEVLSKLYEAVGGHRSSELKHYTDSLSTKHHKSQHIRKPEHCQSELNVDISCRLRNEQVVGHKHIQERQGKQQFASQEQQHIRTREQVSSYNNHQHGHKHVPYQHQQERYEQPAMAYKRQQICKQGATDSQQQPVFNHNYSVTEAMPTPSLHSVRRSSVDHRQSSDMKEQKYMWNEKKYSQDSEMKPGKKRFQMACELDKTKRSSSLHNINFTSLSAPVFENIDLETNPGQRVNFDTRVIHNNDNWLKDCNKAKQYGNTRQQPSDAYENNSIYVQRIFTNSQVNKSKRSSKDSEQMSVKHLDSPYEAAKLKETYDGYNSSSSLVSHSSSSKSDGSQEHKQMYTKQTSSTKSPLQYLQDNHSLSGVSVNTFPRHSSHTYSAPPVVVDMQVNRNFADHARTQGSLHNKPNNSQEQWLVTGNQNNQEVTNSSYSKSGKMEDIESHSSTKIRPVSETILDYYKRHEQRQHNPPTSNALNSVVCHSMNQNYHSNNNLLTEVRQLPAKKHELYNNRGTPELSVSQEIKTKRRTGQLTVDSSHSHHILQSESTVGDQEHQITKNHHTSDSSHFGPSFDSTLSDSSQTIVEGEAPLTSSIITNRNMDDHSREKPSYNRSLSGSYFRQSNQQPRGITVLPTETERGLDVRQRRGSDGCVQLSSAGVNNKLLPYVKKDHVVYHSAMVQLNLTPEVNAFTHSVDEENRSAIERSLTSIKQEISVQRRERLKTQKLFRRLNDQIVAGKKGDQNVIEQMMKDMADMTSKLSFLYLCQTHYQMLLAELHGLDESLLYSLTVSDGSTALNLQPVMKNPHLQFRSICALDGEQMTVLQAGTPRGLMSYLYTSSALSIGFIQQFLLCFRYILTADQLLNFIIEKYNSARRSKQQDVNMTCIQCRSTDLLHFWVEGFYSIDFAPNKGLLKKFSDFLAEQTNANTESIDSLFSLYAACRIGENAELMHTTEVNQDDTEEGTYYFSMGVPKRWDSYRSLLKRSRSDKSHHGSNGSFGKSRSNMKTVSPEHGKSSPFALADCPAHVLAEQLTLIEQELFKKCHPVHYLNSQFQGVGVALSMPGLRTPSMTRKSEANQGPKKGLFIGEPSIESYVVKMINHSQELAHWVSAEILSSGSSKAQINLITKFLTAAHLCQEVRNYATALSILDGLENLVIRQLPAWKNSPAKSMSYMDELTDIKMKLKSEALWLMKNKDWYIYPTIPCALFLALHIQQAEIGSFTLANGMYKWDKMRSITDIVDQLRIFRDHSYGFQPDFEIQKFLHRCLIQYSDQDLHMVASTHDSNFHKRSSSTSLSGTLKKVKGIFKKKV